MNMADIAGEKQQLRRQAQEARRKLDMTSISSQLREQIQHWRRFQEAQTILIYAALPTEVDLLPLTAQYPNKTWYLPRVGTNNRMEFHRYNPGDELKANVLGIREPLPSAALLTPSEPIDLIIVPALLLDTQGTRLGFGKGFYDRFLNGPGHHATTACVVPEALFTKNLPKDAWDIPMKWGITEKQIYHFPVLKAD